MSTTAVWVYAIACEQYGKRCYTCALVSGDLCSTLIYSTSTSTTRATLLCRTSNVTTHISPTTTLYVCFNSQLQGAHQATNVCGRSN